MISEGDTLKVLLIGIDYFAYRGSSDKNFWYRLLPLLADTCEEIVVISFNYRTIKVETQPTACRSIQIFNVRPSHIGIDLRPDPSTMHNEEKCHSHFKSPPRSPLEYFLSFVRIRRLVQRLIRERSITNIHLMDNFGPAMHLLRRWVSPVPVSVSAMGYRARGPLHDWYLQRCFQGLDAVVPFSSAYHHKLLELGLPAQRLHTIPWGIDVKSVGEPPTSEERDRIKSGFGIEPGCKVVLWTGFIQQIEERELHASLEIAHRLTQRRRDVHFVFALKPECYRPSYQHFEDQRVHLLTTTNEAFSRLLRAADYLLSPITNTESIVTPPLTWIEAMAVGVPVVTNRLPGVEAIVSPRETGFVAESVDGIPVLLDAVLSNVNQEQVRENTREYVLTRYTVAKSAISYRRLWQQVLHR